MAFKVLKLNKHFWKVWEELRETVPKLVTSPQTTLPVDTPPLVAVKVQSRLLQSSGPAEAAPVMVSVAPVSGSERAISAEVGNPTSLHTEVVLHN